MSEHLSHLETVFSRLSQHGLQVKAEKCKPDSIVDLPYKLYTDASDLCVGGPFCARHKRMELNMWYNMFHINSPQHNSIVSTQQHCATIEKEAYTVVYALQKLHPYHY